MAQKFVSPLLLSGHLSGLCCQLIVDNYMFMCLSSCETVECRNIWSKKTMTTAVMLATVSVLLSRCMTDCLTTRKKAFFSCGSFSARRKEAYLEMTWG